MTEVELKFIADGETGHHVWERVRELGLAKAKPAAVQLESTYFDTADMALRQAGISLRLRSKGRSWLQTVKYGRKLGSGLSRAMEVEVPVAGPAIDLDKLPDADIRERILGKLKGAPVAPVVITRISRRARELTLENGARVELAVDAGEIDAGGRSDAFCEIEIELVEGAASDLFAFARQVLPAGVLRFSRFSKAERGFLLAEKGYVEPPLTVRKARVVPLEKGETIDEAISATLRECFEQISLNLALAQVSEEPEGPHQLRVGLRRLRSMMSVYRGAMPSDEVSRLGAEAKWLAGEAGCLRDVDAVTTDLVLPVARANQAEKGFAILLGELRREAGARRAALRGTFASPRIRDFLLDLALLIETWGEGGEAGDGKSGGDLPKLPDYAAGILDKRWRRVAKRARAIATMEIEERHELRKDLKKLRYAVEFLGPLYKAKKVREFTDHLKDLQQVTGDVTDAVVAEELMNSTGLISQADPDLQRAVGWVIGAGQARAQASWTHAESLWKALKKTTPFW